MKQFPFYLLLASMLLALPLRAQEKKDARLLPLINFEIIDTAQLKVTYKYEFVDSTKTYTNAMVLLVGPKVQTFQGEADYHMDSLGVSLEGKAYPTPYLTAKMNQFPPKRSTTEWKVYTGYPSGMVSITDRVLATRYLSEERLETPAWKLQRGYTKNIMGYTCYQAEIDLYGRHWIVWYAPQLQCSAGPWVLRGLPGLIVEAYDSEQIHRFSLESVASLKAPIPYVVSNYFMLPRDRVVKDYMRYAEDLDESLIQSGMVTPEEMAISEKKKNRRRIPFVPLRRITMEEARR